MRIAIKKYLLFLAVALFTAGTPYVISNAIAAFGDPEADGGTSLGTCAITQPSLVGVNGEPSSITSEYGMRTHPISGEYKMHTGTDISCPGQTDCNQPVLANPGCTEKFYGTRGGYGNHLILDCGNGVEISYSHLNNWNPATNTMYVGTTGSSTGCHLHYEAKIDGRLVDPECLWGTGTNCPTNTGSGNTSIPNTCDPEQREALKNHETSADGTPNPSGGDGGEEGNADPQTPGDEGNHSHDFNDDTDPFSEGTGSGYGDSDGDGGSGGDSDGPTEHPEPPPYNPTASTPPCGNSVCISQEMIDNGQHKNVEADEAESYKLRLTAEGKCVDPTPTNITIFRQTLKEDSESGKKVGETKEYDDAFCTNQGCTYVNDKLEGRGKCE